MVEGEWYHWSIEQLSGPHSEKYIVSQIEQGHLPRSVIVWSSKQQGPADKIFNLQKISQSSICNKPALSEACGHAARRFFARALDIGLNGIIGWIYITFLLLAIQPNILVELYSILDGPNGKLLDVMLTIFFSIFFNAIFIGFTGSSLGKLCFGIKVVDSNSESLGYKKALVREFMVWVKGIGAGLPILLPFTMILSFNALYRRGQAKWDQDLNTQVQYTPFSKKYYILYPVGFAITGVLTAINLLL